jgi:hypothetical protein
MLYIKKFLSTLLVGLCLFNTQRTFSAPSALSLFPIENYPQDFKAWVKSALVIDKAPLLTPQQQQRHYQYLLDHYFGSESPWNPQFINKVLKRPNLYDDLRHAEPRNLYDSMEATLKFHRNGPHKTENKIGYGSNFRPYTTQWFDQLEHNMALDQFKGPLNYKPARRAIATENLQGRTLPTDEVYFFNHNIAGEGYPFDLFQASTLWAGTPLYILGETRDRAWVLVRSPRFVSWVKSTGVARIDDQFIKQWTQSGRFVALTRHQVPIMDIPLNLFRFLGHIGMMLPQAQNTADGTLKALIPIRNAKGKGIISTAQLSTKDAAPMPLTPNIPTFQMLMQHSLGRPYGWGGMYFYNDCASELKNLFVPFGIWIPINSLNQSDPRQCLGSAKDLSMLDEDARLIALSKEGSPFMTIIYVNGHVMLYLGTYADPIEPRRFLPLTYQTIWGLRPRQEPDRRAIIGKTVLFPLLKTYPEDEQLSSLTMKPAFKLMRLDQLPSE